MYQDWVEKFEENKINNKQSKADKMFEELGYAKKEFIYDENHRYSNCVQYIKEDDKTEMERVGFITKKIIEIYYFHKEIAIYHTQTFKDGTISKWNCAVIKNEELQAINEKCKELKCISI